MKEKSCCFTGHRDIKAQEFNEIAGKVEKEIVCLIEKGVSVFLAGGAKGFDTLAAKTVLSLKSRFPHIELHLFLPCKDQTRGWSEQDKAIYADIKEKADAVKVISEKYYRGCMQVRNRAMVDNAAFCICYCRKDSGGTAYTVAYASKKDVSIIRV